MATLQKGERVFANYSKDELNKVLAVSLLNNRRIECPEQCRVESAYNFRTVNGRREFVGLRVEIKGL